MAEADTMHRGRSFVTEGLGEFIERYGIEKRDGKLVLYKAVAHDYWNFVSHDRTKRYLLGTVVTETFYNTDRRESCSYGLHVGTYKCAQEFAAGDVWRRDSPRIVECLVSPKDVVCVPQAALTVSSIVGRIHPEDQKIRCKRLTVIKRVHRRSLKCKVK